MQPIDIFPAPKKITYGQDSFPRPQAAAPQVDAAITAEFAARGITLAWLFRDMEGLPVRMALSTDISPQGYTLAVDAGGIRIDAGGAAGAYYATLTASQIIRQAGAELPEVTVEDAPSLALRGVLIDIGRDKIPQMETLYHLIDLFAAMKLNHLELYMDGYCFQWEGYQYLFSDETPMTAGEIRALDAYARQRFIDLAPNQNCLGHMEHWLDKAPLNRFAECEEGFLFQNLYHRKACTIDVSDPEAEAFVLSLLDELVQNFTSGIVNVNLDEPFELCMGKNKGKDKNALYMDYVRRVSDHCRALGKEMFMWGDVLYEASEYLAQLPDNVTLLDWIYEGSGSFEKNAAAIAKTGRQFILCPGSSVWCSFLGRSDNMRQNIKNAVQTAMQYGGRGILLTDWGDLGHWQYISTSYLPFAYAAGLSWAGGGFDEDALLRYCNREIYRSPDGNAAQLAYALGNYYQLEHAPLFNTTLCFGVMASKYRFDGREDFTDKMGIMLALSRNIAKGLGVTIDDPEIRLDAPALRAYLEDGIAKAEKLNLPGGEGELIQREMALSARMTLHGLSLYQAMTEGLNCAPLYDDLLDILPRHYALWSARNRRGGYARSQAQLLHLAEVYRRC